MACRGGLWTRTYVPQLRPGCRVWTRVSVRSVLRHLPRACGLSIIAAALVPAHGLAAGFSPPAKISGSDAASFPSVAIAPSGRTVVLYTADIGRNGRSREAQRIATGPTPDGLGRPVPLRIPGVPVRTRLSAGSLLARPDGSFVLCLNAGRTQGCSLIAPTGEIGRFNPLPRRKVGWSPAVVRPDGSTVLLRSVRHGKNVITSTDLSSLVLGADGRPGPERPVVRSADEQAFNPNDPSAAVAADGTVAITANLPAVSGKVDRTRLGIRIMQPGSDAFGPVVTVPGVPSDNNISLLSGPTITVGYQAAQPGSYDQLDERYVPLRPDGTFGPTLALPGSGSGNVAGSVVPLSDGQLFAVTSRVGYDADDQDCFNPITGEIGAGPLAPAASPAPSARLSTPGQIAWHQQAVALSDGTVIAAWHDGVNTRGDRRVEASVRVPGAADFTKGQRLPGLLFADEPILVAGGGYAALLWSVDRRGQRFGGSLVMSTYRTLGPYAKSAPLARRPGTSCDE